MPTYRGSCHCGAVRYRVSGELAGLVVCNCSICTRTGYIHWTVPPADFRLESDWSAIETYEFGTRTAKHHFCRHCGVSPFRVSRSDPDDVTVNVRCLEGVDLGSLEIASFDGVNWEQQMARLGR